MAAFTTTPTPAGEGPSVLGVAAAIGAKIRDAAENAKEEREKAQEAGETPKKGSLFKSALANQFNPIKSKKAKSNWAKQFSWNKPKDKPVSPPTEGDGANGSAKLKEFIAGGFTAILKDTGVMVAKLGGISDGVGQNLAATNRSSSTLTVIKETLDAQTDLRRKALEEAKYARAEKELEKTQDTSSTRSPAGESGGGKGDGEGDRGGGPFDWIKNIFSLDTLFNALGVADIASNFIPKGALQKLNPFKKSPVTQGAGGAAKGGGARVTTSGGAAAPKPGGGNWFKKLLPFADDAAKGGAKLGAAKGAGGLLGRIIPGAQTALGLGLAAQSFAEGDIIGGALNLGSAVPGPLGWAFLTAGLGRDLLGKDMVDNAFGQALGGFGTADTKTQELMSGKSSTENALLGLTTGASFTGFSQGGIVPLARGGIVDNPTKTTLNPGDSVIPLNRNTGKQMLGDVKEASPGETAIDSVGAAILGVSSSLLGETDSGTAGDVVKQKIRKASREFGISNLTFTSSIGKAQFKKVDPNKTAKDFMMSLFDGLQIAGGKDKKSGDGGDNDNPPGGTPESLKGDLEADIGKDASQMKDEIMQSGATGVVDPTQQPWCAAYVNSQLKRQGIQGSGSALADSFENWGAPVSKNNIQYGDVIVGDYGGGSRSHVMFAAGSPKDGAVEIIGGNQSGKVTRGSIALDKIDYVRRAGAQPPALPTQRNNGQATPPPTTPSPQPPANPTNKPAEANLPTGTVSPIFDWNKKTEAESGMVGGVPPQPAWWDIGGRINRWLDEQTYPERYNKQRAMGNNPYFKTGDAIRQMKEQGYAKGGTTSQAKMRQKMKAAQKSKAATQQRLNLGLVKGGNKSGYTVPKTGMRPGESPDQWAQRQSDAIKLADKLNKEQGLGKYAKPAAKPAAPKPRPAPPAAPASGVGPAPAPSSGGAQATTVVTPPVQSSANQSYTGGTFGGNVPSGKSMASTFADFLYTDLIE